MKCEVFLWHGVYQYRLVDGIMAVLPFMLGQTKIVRYDIVPDYLLEYHAKLCFTFILMKWISWRWDMNSLVCNCLLIKHHGSHSLILISTIIFFIYWISGTRLMELMNFLWAIINTIELFNYVDQ